MFPNIHKQPYQYVPYYSQTRCYLVELNLTIKAIMILIAYPKKIVVLVIYFFTL